MLPAPEITLYGQRRMVDREDVRVLVDEGLRRDPDLTEEEIGERLGCHASIVYRMLSQQRIALDRYVALLRAVHVDPWEVGL